MIVKVKSEEVEIDGIIYIIDTYSNGGTVKYPKPEPQPEPPEWEKDLIDEGTEADLEMQMNLQYLVDITEINEGA